jgi:hypothetical protein
MAPARSASPTTATRPRGGAQVRDRFEVEALPGPRLAGERQGAVGSEVEFDVVGFREGAGKLDERGEARVVAVQDCPPGTRDEPAHGGAAVSAPRVDCRLDEGPGRHPGRRGRPGIGVVVRRRGAELSHGARNRDRAARPAAQPVGGEKKSRGQEDSPRLSSPRGLRPAVRRGATVRGFGHVGEGCARVFRRLPAWRPQQFPVFAEDRFQRLLASAERDGEIFRGQHARAEQVRAGAVRYPLDCAPVPADAEKSGGARGASTPTGLNVELAPERDPQRVHPAFGVGVSGVGRSQGPDSLLGLRPELEF